MWWKKMTREQKGVASWRARRNHLVCKLLDADPFLRREEALKMADEKLKKPKVPPEDKPSRRPQS